LYDEFEYKVSPLEIRYKKTGQTIYFRGLDDETKLKSIKPEFGYIGILWFEELDQFSGPEEVRNIRQSAIRGGESAWVFKSFNPPKTKDNWANKYVNEPNPNMLVHSSTYKDVPSEWLGRPFIEEAEHLKEVNPDAYEHEYDGVPNGNGGNVFDKLSIRTITDEEIARFDRIYQGVDWGWFPDPFAFVRLHYDAARETIYILDEIYANKLSNEQSAVKIKEKGYTDAYITCDSAEHKSTADYRALGLPAKDAVKGPGSVEYGMKWLQRRKIVIDPARTPNAHREFTNYEYERNKNGDIISGYPDENNHAIDAVRYALERVFRRMGVTA
ncbi:MAG: PBSX family phage terminase large subunit, partial [Bacteroidaceae bacterium]|nr:PBSX family phage terminase large subunit [Bacteroidaceae bacterium]